MPEGAIAGWHEFVRTRDPALLHQLLAPDAVFESPVVHTPQAGRPIVETYLIAAMSVLGADSFRYENEWLGERSGVLEFAVELDGITINGVDMIHWNDTGQIVRFKVMVRPLKAINLLHQKMGAMLAAAG